MGGVGYLVIQEIVKEGKPNRDVAPAARDNPQEAGLWASRHIE
jgi:hypothetical protein